MRKVIVTLIIAVSFSCSNHQDKPVPQVYSYAYNQDELDLLDRINSYRDSVGVETLALVEHVSYKCLEHNEYMIEKNSISHDYFYNRSENIKQVCDATRVGEILAYNYNTNTSVLLAWKSSPAHDTLVKSKFRRVGISIRQSPTTNRKFYTVIFID